MRLSPFALPDRLFAPAPAPARVAWLRGLEVAHRGLHDATIPENSGTAFTAAIARGLAIECDVQLTADGEAVVFHDFTLERLTSALGPVIDRSAAALARIPLTGSHDRIPSLAAMLDLVAGQVPLLIELKSRRGWAIERLCVAVERALAGYQGAHAVMSFDPRVPRWFSAHAPARVRGLVLSEFEKPGWAARLRRRVALWSAHPDFLACDIRGLPGSLARAQRRRGLAIATWTVRTPAQRSHALACAEAVIAEAQGLP